MSRKIQTRKAETQLPTSEGDEAEGDTGNQPTVPMTDILMLMEEQRKEDRERDRKFQDMMLHMLQTQTAQLEVTKQKEETRRDEERRLEEARLLELEKQREQDEKRHLELLELEKQKLQAETRQQEEREKSRREEDARRQHERELDRKLRDESIDAELFLAEFEAHMTDLEIPRHRWMTSLRPLLADWLQDVLDPLPQEERSVYATAKAEIMSAYSLRYGSLGHRLVMQERPKGMSGSQWLSQIVRRWKQWTADWDCNEIANQYAIEYGLKGLPYACRNFCREQRPKSARELGGLIDKFFSDRDSHIDEGKWYQKRTPQTNPYQQRYQPSFREKEERIPVPTASVDSPTQPGLSTPRSSGDQQRRMPWRPRDPDWESRIECYICKKKGHAAYRCPDKIPQVHALQVTDGGLTVEGLVGETHTTLLLDSGAELTLVPPALVDSSCLTGKTRTVMGATGWGVFPTLQTVIQIGKRKAPMTVLAKEGLAQPLLGRDFPGFYQLLAEAIEGMEERACPTEVAGELMQADTRDNSPNPPVLAVQTRQQKLLEQKRATEDDDATAMSGAIPFHLTQLGDELFSESRGRRRLSRAEKRAQAACRFQAQKTMQASTTFAHLDPHELTAAQLDDESLKSVWAAAEAEEDGYRIQGGILYHRSTDAWGDEMDQVVVPEKFRVEVLALAHCSPLAAHLGRKKTCSKILTAFFWPGVYKDVRDFCHSCEDCQRGGKANRRRAPLMPLPTVEEPFRRLAMDIVGPLRETKRGHKFILTIMDFATRYPEAIPLRRIDAATVAEALCGVFTRLGIPEEILSDQGSNFMSELLSKVMELLQIHHLKTSPYHPQTDGMLERFHGTLKGMMRKTCRQRNDWDEYLPYVCFAFRDSVHSSTGFTPFQLLFGRDMRGPMSLLREQLTGQTTGSRTVVEFVDNLKAKLYSAWEQAAENDGEAKARSKKYFDRTATSRNFQTGNQVLVMSPSQSDKFEAQWAGPYTVQEKVTDVTYRISTPDRRKKLRLYHANAMKLWTTPVAVMAVRYCSEEENTGEEEHLEPQIYLFETTTETRPTINCRLTAEQKRQMEDLLDEFKEIFSDDPGCTMKAEHSIKTGENPPVYRPPYRMPHAWQKPIREEVQKMLQAGIIEPSESAWTSPLMPVKKKDGSLRLCVDYRSLNLITEDDRYPMPRVDELLEKLGISTLDLTKGYYQVPVSQEDQAKTAFMTPMGKFQFRRMPFGLKGAPTTFQRLMDVILSQCHQYSSAYIDDISVFSQSWEEHLAHLRDVFERLQVANLKAKARKCHLGMEEGHHLGHQVGRGKIQLEQAKVEAIATFRKPKTQKDMRAFLGLTGYYRRFIPRFATLMAGLSDQTKKDKPNNIQWTPELEIDFDTLRQELCKKPILACPDEDKPFILQTDCYGVE